uniref:N-acetylneuraminic acid synthase b n=1 Tax=Cyprinus carpio TaxID=7962 RepID=A0A8C1JQV1_CYPCA
IEVAFLDCGADCAKFQKSKIEHRFTKHALERPYTSPHAWGPTYGAHKHHLEFSHQQYRELQQYANDIGIFFTASGMDEMAIEFLHEINVPFFKVASADTNNIPYLEKTFSTSNVKKTKTRPNLKNKYLVWNLSISHFLLQEFQKEFPDIPIGYSGHETGIHVSVAAVALGAKVLERHVTLDKTWKGSDHAASLEPAELAELVRAIRMVEMAMGSPIKQMLPCEASCHSKLGKSVVARKPLQKGEILTLDMLTVKVAEPHGVRPENIFKLVGKKITEDLEEDATITDAMIKG